MSDFGFVNRRGDNNRSGKRTSLNAGIGPMPTAGQGQGQGQSQQQQQQQQGHGPNPGAGRGRGAPQRNGVPRYPGAGAPGPGPGPRMQFDSSEDYYRGAGVPSSGTPRAAVLAPMPPPVAPRTSILKRQPPPPQQQLYPLEDDGDGDRKPPSLAPVPVASPTAPVLAHAPEIKTLQTELKSSQQAASDLKTELEALKSEVKILKGNDTQFFGLVEGGLSGRALLFDTPPKEMTAEKASAKADKDAWVKLSHPQLRTERKLANGSTVVDMWLRAYAICPRTSDVNPFWVRERAEDDTPTFKKFAWYPTPGV